jgi:hypothetical protein
MPLLDGRYEIGDHIASGGAASVHRARDTRLQRDVAIKLLSDQAAKSADPAGRDRFVRESHTAAQLHHPHLVTVFDAGEADGQLYMVMELVDGTTLAQIISECAPMPADDAVDIARQVLDGLAAVHERGVVHRDVKPANVLVDAHGRVRLTDFGIARRLGDIEEHLTGSGQVMGTPTYLSPEQAVGDDATSSTDLYLVGLILDEMLTGRRLRSDTPSGRAAALAAARSTPFDPRDVEPALAAELAAVVIRATDPDPARRYRSASEMSDALGAAVGDAGDASSTAVLRSVGAAPATGVTATAVTPGVAATSPATDVLRPAAAPATAVMQPVAAAAPATAMMEPAVAAPPATEVFATPATASTAGSTEGRRDAPAHGSKNRWAWIVGALVVALIVLVIAIASNLADDVDQQSTSTVAAADVPVYVGETLDGRQVEIRPSETVPFDGDTPVAISEIVAAAEGGCDRVYALRDEWTGRTTDPAYGDAASVFAQHAQNVAVYIRCEAPPADATADPSGGGNGGNGGSNGNGSSNGNGNGNGRGNGD